MRAIWRQIAALSKLTPIPTCHVPAMLSARGQKENLCSTELITTAAVPHPPGILCNTRWKQKAGQRLSAFELWHALAKGNTAKLASRAIKCLQQRQRAQTCSREIELSKVFKNTCSSQMRLTSIKRHPKLLRNKMGAPCQCMNSKHWRNNLCPCLSLIQKLDSTGLPS